MNHEFHCTIVNQSSDGRISVPKLVRETAMSMMSRNILTKILIAIKFVAGGVVMGLGDIVNLTR